MNDLIERAALAAWLAYCGVEDSSKPDYDDGGDWQGLRDTAEQSWREWPEGCTHIGADGFRRCAKAALEAASRDNGVSTEMIYPGDRRHPCPVCSGRRPGLMHSQPCRPVSIDKAHIESLDAARPATETGEE